MYGVYGFVEEIEMTADERPIIDSISGHIINEQCQQYLTKNISSSWISSNFAIDVYLQV